MYAPEINWAVQSETGGAGEEPSPKIRYPCPVDPGGPLM
ncbi:hypothetical protein pah_c029o068 [Parachlamydia acanthamoebae str. Hall's coccus]|nr:hypothetical protein pah_c029o068 [Parachlamydia acanthamoebae str. Hall's coccus]